MHPPDAAASRLIGGRYELGEVLGRGGLGVVRRARDTLLGRDVAVKEVVFPLFVSEEERSSIRTRVVREARAAARLSDPGVVTVFDVLEEDGRSFIVMEIVSAPSLQEVVHMEGPLPSARVGNIGREVLRVLEVVHQGGIVHRDVKPGNVMIFADGRVKLGDFGIASVQDEPGITQTGMVVGSPAYMAPEQAAGGEVGPATDLWGLGATMYFAVEGRSPFERGAPLATLNAVLHEEPPAPTRAGPLAPVILGLLSRDPSARPSGPALARMLEDVSQGDTLRTENRSTGATRRMHEETVPLWGWTPPATELEGPRRRAAGRQATTRRPPPDRQHPPRRARRRRGPAAALVAGLAVLAVLAAAAGVRLVGSALDDEAPPKARTSPSPIQGINSSPSPADTPAAGADTGTEETAPPTSDDDPTEAPGSTDTEGTVDVAGEWTTYRDEATGYTVDYPAGWEVSRLDRTRTDFSDPDSGTYLRIDWTDNPGPSAVGAWESYSKEFAKTHTGYEEIQITATTYKGYEAALWEFRYTSGDQLLHAVDLGFVTGDYGFALNFQTSEEEWEESQPLFSRFKQTFQPPE